MKVVYTTWRSQISVSRDTYHVTSVKHEGEVFTMYGVDMDEDVRPPGVLMRAREVALTVVVGDSYVVYDCDDSCELHS